jgi:integrase
VQKLTEVRIALAKPPLLHQFKPAITPHCFRHNYVYVTLVYESGIDPLVAMRIVGHTDYQTTANIYTHLKEETLKKASVNMEKVFRSRAKSDADK